MSREYPKNGAIDVRDVTKKYQRKTVFENLSLEVESGMFTLLMGPSGSGKTTLLNLMSGLDTPDSGEVVREGRDITKLSKTERGLFRAASGLVFQRPRLIGGLSARRNIEIGHELTGHHIDEAWTDELVDQFRVSRILEQPASQLSLGQAQRIATISALAHRPSVVFADEPTASLDTDASRDVHNVLRHAANDGTTIVMVSHDESARQYADVVFPMKDGKVEKS